MGLGKFWPDLENSEAFVMSLEVSFLRVFFASRGLEFFLLKGLGVSDLSFFRLVFWSRVFFFFFAVLGQNLS